MHLQSAMSLLSAVVVPSPPAEVATEAYAAAYRSYLSAYEACRSERVQCVELLKAAVLSVGVSSVEVAGAVGAAGVGSAETVVSWAARVGAEATGSVAGCVKAPGECVQRGVHYARNQRRKQARKARSVAGEWSAEQKEAERTLALRRVVENKVAVEKGNLLLASLRDTDKTAALRKLEAARMEAKTNEAKASSQASYKRCDESLKSLGSTGSAGEFALKLEAKRAADLAQKVRNMERQMDMLISCATPEVLRQVAEVPEPRYESAFDVIGDCPAHYNQAQATAYYNELQRADDTVGEVAASASEERTMEELIASLKYLDSEMCKA